MEDGIAKYQDGKSSTCCTDHGKDKSDLARTCHPIGAFIIRNSHVSAFCPPPALYYFK